MLLQGLFTVNLQKLDFSAVLFIANTNKLKTAILLNNLHSHLLEHLFEHFKSEGRNGFLGNVSIRLIDKTDGRDPKWKENFWMTTLKTYALFGLNIEDSV